ncbi:MAG: dihydropyrimidinase [Treponema sp.]|jgi:dihydropyrimidinase|nr:dihydropyrimidinase [Treponema sp.]
MNKTLLITGALVAAPEGEAVRDVLVEGELIRRVGPVRGSDGEADPRGGDAHAIGPIRPDWEVIDGRGKVLIPGGVDAHTHICLDTGSAVVSDDFYSGTRAAVWGGTTTLIDHPGFGPPGCPLDHQIRKYHDLARGKAVIDYGFHGVVQHVDDGVIAALEDLAEEGITSCKIYLTYGFKLNDGEVLRVLEKAGSAGILTTVHPENDGAIGVLRDRFIAEGKGAPRYHALSRPAECEAEAVNRMILLARLASGAPLYIVHLSSALALEFLRQGRIRGQKDLYAETCPQYLFLDDSRYDLPDGLKYVISPPLRTKADNEILWRALAADIDTAATDHCAFLFESQKILGKDDFTKCPNGAPGIEERIPLLFSEGVGKGRISLRRFVELCSTNPAKLFGLYPRKGVIREGSDADLVLMDPAKKWTIRREGIHGNADYSPYEGMELRGAVDTVIARGTVLLRNGVFNAEAGRGRFLRRGRFDSGLGAEVRTAAAPPDMGEDGRA